MTLLAFVAFRVLDRRAIPRTLEVHIPLPAFATFAKHKLLTVFREINDRIFVVDDLLVVPRLCWLFRELVVFVARNRSLRAVNDCADRHVHDFILGAATMHFLAHPMAA